MSKHLRALTEAGLVSAEPRARRRIYRLEPEGEEEGTTIRHTNELTLSSSGDTTEVTLHVVITEIGPKAKMAAFGMKWGDRQQLDQLGELFQG